MKLLGLLLLVGLNVFCQNERKLVFPETDSLYREDQIYVAGSFHVIENRPTDIDQTGFSGGLDFGFIRDMPINKKRNIAFGLGLGYSMNIYNHDLYVDDTGSTTTYREVTDDDDLDYNRFSIHTIEMPIQFRWRTSTPESYKFWRIYTGLQLGYMHYFNARTVDNDGNKTSVKNPDGLDRMRIGASLSFGWNTFNFYVYYGLNNLFDDSVTVVDQQGGINIIKFGLMFYIL